MSSPKIKERVFYILHHNDSITAPKDQKPETFYSNLSRLVGWGETDMRHALTPDFPLPLNEMPMETDKTTHLSWTELLNGVYNVCFMSKIHRIY